jgi:KaiC/GvpD/RAD55 family RecA-like ATPase
MRYRGLFREQEPDIDGILKHSRVVLVGEPGSGKTVVTLEGAKRLARAVSLKSYGRNLRTLLRTAAPDHGLDAGNARRVSNHSFDALPDRQMPQIGPRHMEDRLHIKEKVAA